MHIACAYLLHAILKRVLIDCDAYFDYHVFKKSLIVPDLLDIIILSQHYDMICWNSIYLANLINVRMAKCARVCVTLPTDNLIILFIVLFFSSFFCSMGLLPKQDYIFMINIICVFLHFSHFRFQLFVIRKLNFAVIAVSNWLQTQQKKRGFFYCSPFYGIYKKFRTEVKSYGNLNRSLENQHHLHIHKMPFSPFSTVISICHSN